MRIIKKYLTVLSICLSVSTYSIVPSDTIKARKGAFLIKILNTALLKSQSAFNYNNSQQPGSGIVYDLNVNDKNSYLNPKICFGYEFRFLPRMFKKSVQDDRWKLSFETGFFTFNTISKKQGTYQGGFLRSNFTGEIYDKYKYNFSFIKPSFSYSLINPNKTSLSFHIGVTSYFNYKVTGYSFEKNQTNGVVRQIDYDSQKRIFDPSYLFYGKYYHFYSLDFGLLIGKTFTKKLQLGFLLEYNLNEYSIKKTPFVYEIENLTYLKNYKIITYGIYCKF